MNEFPGYNDSVKAFEKAEDALENAEYNLKGNYFLAVANRLGAKFSELFIKPESFLQQYLNQFLFCLINANRLITIWILISTLKKQPRLYKKQVSFIN